MKYLDRLEKRRDLYLKFLKGIRLDAEILIIGDRPGPAAPRDIDYHHTPFYSDKHCSGWLNSLLEKNNIPEEKLVWINAYDKDGVANCHVFLGLSHKSNKCAFLPNLKEIIVLGGNAEKWFTECVDVPHTYFHHPQYWKRFQNKKAYPLIKHLKKSCGVNSK